MFDPTLPANGTPLVSAEMRAQLNGLKDLIDAVPTISGAVIDGVTTVPAGQPATVNVNLASGVLHFSFQVPQGQDGQAGQDGAPGQTGAQGPPFANAVVDGVTTLNPSEAATVQTSFDGSDVHFTFGIPRGQEGASAAPITSFLVDGVNTLNPGDNATVQGSFDGASVRFTFGIPRGNDGTNGSNGTDGSQGPAGPPFTNFIVDGVNMLNPTDPASVQTTFDGNAVRLLFNVPRGFTGSDGAQGPAGPPFTNFVVDGVNMLNPTDPASVQATFDGNAVRLLFNLPRGFTGNDGSNGSNGSDGAQGPVGPQGPPFANAVVDSVTTLNPGDNATVQTTFDGGNVRFEFGIPRGFNGTDGMNGSDGATGPQGPPGEVTNAQLSSAIGGTSSNSNAVNPLDTPFANDPPTLADLELMRAKMNELIAALRR